MRDIAEIIDRMIAAMPDTETALIAELNHVRQSALYTAPELMGTKWRQVGDACRHHLSGRMNEEWPHVVGRIFSGQPEPEPGALEP